MSLTLVINIISNCLDKQLDKFNFIILVYILIFIYTCQTIDYIIFFVLILSKCIYVSNIYSTIVYFLLWNV